VVRILVASALVLAALIGPAAAAPTDVAAPILAGVSGAAPTPQKIQPDPAVRRGVLPNGLHYEVMRNAKPEGGMSLRLGMDVGSFEEQDDERGAAHFVEHMVFNGSKNFAEGEVDKIFQKLGVTFGRDQNAGTGLFATIYGLDLRTTQAAPVETAFRWLRDVADGASFEQKAVDRERGVILAEREMDLTPIEATREAIRAFQGAGLRSTERDPIGTVESIRRFDAAALKAFYKRWYRPENATVVVVGDLPVEVLEKQVAEAFSSWRGEGPAPVRAEHRKPTGKRGLEILVRDEPNAPTMVEACRARPAEPLGGGDIPSMRRTVAGQLWRRILESRMTRASIAPEPPYLGASIFFTDTSREAAETCLSLIAADDDWRRALKSATAELRRLAERGPTEHEFETVLEEFRSRYRGAVGGAPTRDTPSLAQNLAESALTVEVTPAPREALRAYNAAVEELNIDDIKAAIARDWSGDGPLLSVISPKAPDKETLLAVWREAEAAPLLAQYVEPPITAWQYKDFGRKGAVARREQVAAGDFTRFTFRNGVVLNFKHTDFQNEEVLVDVRFAGGQQDIANSDAFMAEMAASAFKSGGLGRESVEEAYAQLGANTWEADLIIGYDAFRLRGRSNVASLDRQIYVLAAYMADPGFRPAIDARLSAMMKATYRSYATSPELVMSTALQKVLDPVHGGPPTQEEAARMRARDFERLLKPIITGAPMEISIVGDADEKTVVDLVSATFGALPKRREWTGQGVSHAFTQIPPATPKLIRATHEGSSEQAIASLIWPLYIAVPERRREEMAINVAAEILSNNIRRRVREDLGKSYAPEASTSMPDKADQGVLTAVIEAYPGDIEAVVAEAKSLAKAMAAGGITQADLDETLLPMVSRMKAESRTNAFWLDVLSGSAADDKRAPDIIGLETLTASLTLPEVKKAAADWLAQEPIVVLATPKAAIALNATPAAAVR
jgi:zinc protease